MVYFYQVKLNHNQQQCFTATCQHRGGVSLQIHLVSLSWDQQNHIDNIAHQMEVLCRPQMRK